MQKSIVYKPRFCHIYNFGNCVSLRYNNANVVMLEMRGNSVCENVSYISHGRVMKSAQKCKKIPTTSQLLATFCQAFFGLLHGSLAAFWYAAGNGQKKTSKRKRGKYCKILKNVAGKGSSSTRATKEKNAAKRRRQ